MNHTKCMLVTLLSFLIGGICTTTHAFDPGPGWHMERISETIKKSRILADNALKNVQDALKKLNEAQGKLQEALSGLAEQEKLQGEMKKETNNKKNNREWVKA